MRYLVRCEAASWFYLALICWAWLTGLDERALIVASALYLGATFRAALAKYYDSPRDAAERPQ